MGNAAIKLLDLFFPLGVWYLSILFKTICLEALDFNKKLIGVLGKYEFSSQINMDS